MSMTYRTDPRQHETQLLVDNLQERMRSLQDAFMQLSKRMEAQDDKIELYLDRIRILEAKPPQIIHAPIDPLAFIRKAVMEFTLK